LIAQRWIDKNSTHRRRNRDYGAHREINATCCYHQGHPEGYQHQRRPVVKNVNKVAVQVLSVYGVFDDAEPEETWLDNGIKDQNEHPGH
jgi:hypothetical protein